MINNKLRLSAALVAASLVLAACGSGSDSGSENTGSAPPSQSESTPSAGSGPTGQQSAAEPATGGQSAAESGMSSNPAPASGSGAAPQLSADSFTQDFSAMKKLKSVADAGKGKIAVILPDTVSSARYTEFDEPMLTKAFQMAGLSDDQFSIVNAQGSTADQLTDAQTAISGGATVLVVDPLDSGTGAQIQSYAKDHGVPTIDYDRLTLGGSRDYYISFDNVKVGKLIGQGIVQCAKDWGVTDPKFIEMKGDPTDNNATLFAQGYDSVLDPLVKDGSWDRVAEPAGTWKPPKALTLFQQAFTAHPDANAAVVPNDSNAAPIINYLQKRNVKPQSFPITGQDATVVGLQNILKGYQCGTVYKAIYLEAQAAAALSLYLRAGQTPPDGLVNGTTKDTKSGTDVPSVLLPPQWVTPKNMADTVVKDQFVKVSKLCSKDVAKACAAAGIQS